MWLEFIDKGHVIPSPLNVLYYILKVITKVTLIIWETKCHCNCQKVRINLLPQNVLINSRIFTTRFFNDTGFAFPSLHESDCLPLVT